MSPSASPSRTETIPLVDESELTVSVGEPDGAVRGGIVVLHESRGVTERTDRIIAGLAGEGWLVVAPHLFHRSDDADRADPGDDPRDAARLVSADSVLADSDAAFGWLADHGVASDRMGVLGFDMGATVALVVAAKRTLGAAVTVAAAGVSTPLAEGLPRLVDVVGEVTCPWLGLYGETGDPLDPADVDRLRDAAHASGRVVDVVVYPDREHRFDADAGAGDHSEELVDSGDEDSTVVDARSRVLNWFDAHLR